MIAQWKSTPEVDRLAMAPAIADKLDAAMESFFSGEGACMQFGCHMLAHPHLRACGLCLVEVWTAMGKADMAKALADRLAKAKERRALIEGT